MAGLKEALDPLIQKKATLDKIIKQVSIAAINEINTKEIGRQIALIDNTVKDQSTRQLGDLSNLATRLSVNESTLASMHEEFLEVKFMCERIKNQSDKAKQEFRQDQASFRNQMSNIASDAAMAVVKDSNDTGPLISAPLMMGNFAKKGMSE